VFSNFQKLADAKGYTATGAFERFMEFCVEAGELVFAERQVLDFDVEARVLVDWLSKGKRFYRTETGQEMNIQGRLLWLLPKVKDAALQRNIEEAMKNSVAKQE